MSLAEDHPNHQPSFLSQDGSAATTSHGQGWECAKDCIEHMKEYKNAYWTNDVQNVYLTLRHHCVGDIQARVLPYKRLVKAECIQ